MAKSLQFRRYTTPTLSTITGLAGELIVDSTLNTITVHDGVTAGGWKTISNTPTPGGIGYGTGTNIAITGAGSSGQVLISSGVGVPSWGFVSSYMFSKSNPTSVAFVVTGTGTATTNCIISLDINSKIYNFASSTNIVMPTLTAGTDYAIYTCTDGTIRADANFTTPTGYTSITSRKIGGFHYAPGGNAAAQSGGNTTPQINPYSFWDLKFKPNVSDPRGMVYCGSNFWADIYLTNTNYLTNGTSKYNVAYACGTTPPLISTLTSGTGSNSYAEYGYYSANEVLTWAGKRCPTVREFQLLAYGTTENTSSSVQDNSTIWRAAYVSKYGVNQVSGCLDVWGSEFGGGAQSATWQNLGLSRGQQYQLPNAALLGGYWAGGGYAGSRYSRWYAAPSFSDNAVGSRGVGDHLILV